VKRGDILAHPSNPDRVLVLVSADQLTQAGTALLVELADAAPAGLRGLLTVTLDADQDGVAGVVRVDRLGYYATGRLGAPRGALSDATMQLVDMALRTALDLN
jgi:mRNA-degrading endonuclease toxin of MazEF toxin-antitoxin module